MHLVIFGLFTGALLFAGFIKTRRALRVFRWVADTPDRQLRRLLVVSIVPGLAAAIGLVVNGLPPPPALASGAILTLGVLVATAGVLGIEGSLVEPGSEAEARVALGHPPKTSAAGRAVAIAVGAALTWGAGALCWYASQI